MAARGAIQFAACQRNVYSAVFAHLPREEDWNEGLGSQQKVEMCPKGGDKMQMLL